MNSLSWLLYFADVVQNIRGTIAGFMFLVGAIFLFSGVAWIFSKIAPTDDDISRGMPESFKKAVTKVFTFSIWLLVVLNVLSIVTPTKTTILSIAASEFAEYVVSTEEIQTIGGEAGDLITNSIRLLNEQITEQLKPAEVAK